ncbi:hypothetical protein V6582_21670 [Agrobacterium vitis]|uniref:hypothetical protein n=1 Tax=Agrobacterium vitis TaxID=373 RepID=UPI0012E80B9B|nr:hypothetical protein [Agrobacterium vitis]MVA26592.1 hypothetical protein [Agrobacterium vitis]
MQLLFDRLIAHTAVQDDEPNLKDVLAWITEEIRFYQPDPMRGRLIHTLDAYVALSTISLEPA